MNHESGLPGISVASSDLRDLLANATAAVRAAEAVALFCDQAKKWTGAYTAALGGLDTLVFAGGIGENAPPARARICERPGFLGIMASKTRNAKPATVISIIASRVTLRVIPTDEELVMARPVGRVPGLQEAEMNQGSQLTPGVWRLARRERGAEPTGFQNERATPPAAKRTRPVASLIYFRRRSGVSPHGAALA